MAYLPYAQALLDFLLEEQLDDVLGGSIKALVLPLWFLADNAALYLLLLHLLLLALGAFERGVASHHLVDTAAQSPPVHRCPVWSFGQELRGHVCSSTGLEEEEREREGEAFSLLRLINFCSCSLLVKKMLRQPSSSATDAISADTVLQRRCTACSQNSSDPHS
ncbi:hypothetical protein EYF80_019931 [Liparis tanakae]|uniref:Uncharacterized protein n=1 Tax=Liparis tanakae TaxID=230148 RepID=A0A4Z2HY08_9TELE|nr:hypothetical protein EYF80_019931 [Liparis tanakae]